MKKQSIGGWFSTNFLHENDPICEWYIFEKKKWLLYTQSEIHI
jgi:hypothetical protein